MRFLHISNFKPDPNSGAGGTILGFTDALRARGHDMELLWHQPEPFVLGPNFSRFLELPRRQLAQARAALAGQAYDVVIVHQPHAHRIFSELAPLYPRTVFLNFSHGWEVCDNLQNVASAPRTPWRRLKDAAAHWLARRDCAWAAARAHGVIVLNGADAQFIREFHHAPAERVAVIAPGLDPRLLGLPARPRPMSGAPARLLYAGNYVPMKAPELIEAAVLDAAGGGLDFQFTCVTHRNQHEGIRQRLGPTLGTRLQLENWLPRGELIGLMRGHGILLFPSRYEGFGKMAHEGMACGMAVVGARVGVLADRAEHRRNALLSAPNDGAGFSANVREAINDPALVARLGATAQADVQQDTWEHSAQLLENFVASCRARLAAARL